MSAMVKATLTVDVPLRGSLVLGFLVRLLDRSGPHHADIRQAPEEAS
jgi:hypothetical protein